MDRDDTNGDRAEITDPPLQEQSEANSLRRIRLTMAAQAVVIAENANVEEVFESGGYC